MGTCFSFCLPTDRKKGLRNLNILNTQNNNAVDFTVLIDDNPATCERKLSLFSRLIKREKKRKKKPVLELVDNFLNPQASYSRLNESQQLPSTGSCSSTKDIQLQCLDARALLVRTACSTPASSLDLEWEHETLPASVSHERSRGSWTMVPDDMSCMPSMSGAVNSDSDWSRVSSSENSLEWDNVQNSIQASPPMSDVDTDTQYLLCEIERLTNQTLRETGKDLYSCTEI